MDKIGKTRAFLIEFIIVILFFSVSAIITLQLFLAANEKSQLSIDKTNACAKIQSVAEEIRVNTEYLDSFFSSANGWENDTRYYNEAFALGNKADAKYILRADISEQQNSAGKLISVELVFWKAGTAEAPEEELCRLTVKSYLPDWRNIS